MTIEIMLVIAILGFCVSLYFNIGSAKRAERECNTKDAAIMGTMSAQVKNIDSNVGEVKKDVKTIQRDIGDVRNRLAAVENSTKAAHARINDIVDGKIQVGGKK